MFTTQGTHKQRDASSNGDFKGGINQWGCLTSGWMVGDRASPLSSLRRVLLVSCWRGPETNENSQIWGCLACRWPPLLTTRFLQSACLGRVSTACSCAWLDPCCTVSWFTLSFHSRTTLVTPRTPLNREGALVLRLRSRRFRQKLDYMGVVLKPMQDL